MIESADNEVLNIKAETIFKNVEKMKSSKNRYLENYNTISCDTIYSAV